MKMISQFLLFLLVAGCSASSKLSTETKAQNRINAMDEVSRNEIQSLLNMIDEQMAITDPGAKRYIPYEFRIPIDAKSKKQIHRIDSSVSFIKRKDYYLCIGENATRERVYQVVSLPDTYKIRFCPYE